MKPAFVSFGFCVLLACGGPFGPAQLPADDLPADVSTIKSISPDQARRLVAGYRMAEVEIPIKGRGVFKSDLVLPLNGLERLDAETAKPLTAFAGEVISLGGLQTLDAATARELAQFLLARTGDPVTPAGPRGALVSAPRGAAIRARRPERAAAGAPSR
jgi:hypothetical protein